MTGKSNEVDPQEADLHSQEASKVTAPGEGQEKAIGGQKEDPSGGQAQGQGEGAKDPCTRTPVFQEAVKNHVVF